VRDIQDARRSPGHAWRTVERSDRCDSRPRRARVALGADRSRDTRLTRNALRTGVAGIPFLALWTSRTDGPGLPGVALRPLNVPGDHALVLLALVGTANDP